MAEILGFYDLLRSAGGCVSREMCSPWLDLNSLDTERGEAATQQLSLALLLKCHFFD